MKRQLRTLGDRRGGGVAAGRLRRQRRDHHHRRQRQHRSRTATPVLTPTPGGDADDRGRADGRTDRVLPTETPAPEETETPVAGGPDVDPGRSDRRRHRHTEAGGDGDAHADPGADGHRGGAVLRQRRQGGRRAMRHRDRVRRNSADCAGQCACCLCRPDGATRCRDQVQHLPSGDRARAATFPPGAAETFPGLCE